MRSVCTDNCMPVKKNSLQFYILDVPDSFCHVFPFGQGQGVCVQSVLPLDRFFCPYFPESVPTASPSGTRTGLAVPKLIFFKHYYIILTFRHTGNR